MSSSRIYLGREYIGIATGWGQVVSLPATSLDDTSEVGQGGVEYKERKPRLEKWEKTGTWTRVHDEIRIADHVPTAPGL